MRHENRYFFAHLFGFAGLTVDEILNNYSRFLSSSLDIFKNV